VFIELANSVLFLYVAIPIYLIFLTLMVEWTVKTGFATFILLISLILMQLFSDIHPFYIYRSKSIHSNKLCITIYYNWNMLCMV
jgi:hypothetical protein